MGKFKVRNDRILFVDLELTCWEDAAPEGEFPEIIEVGLAEVDVEGLLIVRSGSFLVRPEYSSVSAYCESLTGITKERLRREGRKLGEVASSLRKGWGTGSKAWMSWGSDRRAVLQDCERKSVINPFSEAFHDIGMQFTLMSGSGSAVGLSSALGLLGLEREGALHRGEDDAIQAARAWIAQAKGLRERLTATTHDPGPRGLIP